MRDHLQSTTHAWYQRSAFGRSRCCRPLCPGSACVSGRRVRVSWGARASFECAHALLPRPKRHRPSAPAAVHERDARRDRDGGRRAATVSTATSGRGAPPTEPEKAAVQTQGLGPPPNGDPHHFRTGGVGVSLPRNYCLERRAAPGTECPPLTSYSQLPASPGHGQGPQGRFVAMKSHHHATRLTPDVAQTS